MKERYESVDFGASKVFAIIDKEIDSLANSLLTSFQSDHLEYVRKFARRESLVTLRRSFEKLADKLSTEEDQTT